MNELELLYNEIVRNILKCDGEHTLIYRKEYDDIDPDNTRERIERDIAKWIDMHKAHYLREMIVMYKSYLPASMLLKKFLTPRQKSRLQEKSPIMLAQEAAAEAVMQSQAEVEHD